MQQGNFIEVFSLLHVPGAYAGSMNNWKYINKITLLHKAGISHYFIRKMHAQTTLQQYLVKFKTIITSVLLKPTSTVSEKLPLRGILPGK